MGMSSSQARLLTLTARMHDIEYRAQRLEAQKLQMANESRRAYESYLEALDATKIQYKSINNDGSITFRDATLNALENGAVSTWEGEASNKTFLLKNGFTDEIYVTPTFADAFGITDGEKIELGTLDDYLHDHDFYESVPVYKTEYQTDYTKVTSFNPAINQLISTPEAEVEGVDGVWNFTGITKADIPELGTRYTLSSFRPIVNPTNSTKTGCVSSASGHIGYSGMFSYNTYTNAVNISTYNIAQNIYLLEAICKGYNSTEYGDNVGKIDDYYNDAIKNYYNVNTELDSVPWESVATLAENLDWILSQSDDDIRNMFRGTDFDDINSIIGAASIVYCGSGETVNIDPEGLQKGNDLPSGTIELNTTGTIPGALTGVNCNCSVNDVYAVIAQAVLNAGGWAGETLDSLLTTTGEGAKLNDVRNLSSVNLAKIYDLSTQVDKTAFNAVIDIIKTGGEDFNTNIQDYLNNIHPDWNNTSVDIKFTPDNKILQENEEQTYNYGYSKKDIIYQIAKDILTKNNSESEEDKNVLITGMLSNVNLDANQWVSIASYYGSEQWDDIIAEFEKAAAGEEYDLSSYITAADGLTVTLIDDEHPVTTPPTYSPGVEHEDAVNGVINIPNVDNIARNIVVAFQENGVELTREERDILQTRIKNKLTTEGYDNRALAEINNMVCTFINSNGRNNKDKITELYNFITETSSSFSVPSSYASDYDFVIDDTIVASEPEYGQKAVQVETDDLTWDTTDPRYKELSKEYYMLKSLEGCTFKVIEEELCNSTEFVSNWLTLNEGYLLEFDNSLYEMVDTNVAVTTHLQEVSDEKDLKKAEAQYEADMRRIDQKDRRYDTQLAALDTERNAVKQEMETVKTVAKDNVDRTFRLFS